MKKKNKLSYWIVIIGLGVLLAGGIVLAQNTTFLDKVAQVAGQVLGNRLADQTGDITLSEEPVIGAIPGTEISGPCWTVGGVMHCYAMEGMRTSTTSPLCSIKPPDNGTSTLIMFGLHNGQGTTSAAVLAIATSTKWYATSSWATIGSVPIPAKEHVVYFATSTQTYMTAKTGSTNPYNSPIYLHPNEYIVVNVSSGLISGQAAGISYVNGKCFAEFIVFP